MKKMLALIVAAVLMLSLAVATYAETDYVESPGHDTEAGDGDIIVTHYDDIDDAHPDVDKDDFQKAYDELKNADDLKDLNDDIKDGAVVRDLYDVTVIGDAYDDFVENGKVVITFDVGLSDDNYQIIHRGKSGWKVISGTRNPADGSVTVTLTELGQVAFLTVPAQGGVEGPQTSDPMAAILVCLAAVSVMGAVIVYKRRRIAE